MSNVQEALKAAIEGLESAESIINEISIVMVKFGVSPEKIGLGRESKLMPIARQCKAALSEIENSEILAWFIYLPDGNHTVALVDSEMADNFKKRDDCIMKPLYTSPQPREGWVSDEAIESAMGRIGMSDNRPLGQQMDSIKTLVRQFAAPTDTE